MPYHMGHRDVHGDSSDSSSDDESIISTDSDEYSDADSDECCSDVDSDESHSGVDREAGEPLVHRDDWSDCASLDDDEYDDELLELFLSPQEMLLKGLVVAGFTPERIARAKDTTMIGWFMDQYGASHIVYSHLWRDLLTTQLEDAAVPREKADVVYFLMSIYFLKKYPTEIDRESKFNFSHATIAKWTWYYLSKIQALKADKIKWDEGKEDDIWILTVDGTHCWINEPKHPSLSQDSAYYGHKYNKAGVDYEFGISLSSNRLIWMSGPHPAGDCSDLTVFTFTNGLRDKLRAAKKRGIGDRGYVGHEELSTPNSHDDKVVAKFKSRALSRHENFNGMTKCFRCIDGRFRHSLEKFAMCFESICVICQCQLEHGNPLYDILTPSMLN